MISEVNIKLNDEEHYKSRSARVAIQRYEYTMKKHVPQRMCVACRQTCMQHNLIRLICTTESRIEIDLKYRYQGRGAYLCRNLSCWEKAMKRQSLERALRLNALHTEDRATLMQFAQGLE